MSTNYTASEDLQELVQHIIDSTREPFPYVVDFVLKYHERIEDLSRVAAISSAAALAEILAALAEADAEIFKPEALPIERQARKPFGFFGK